MPDDPERPRAPGDPPLENPIPPEEVAGVVREVFGRPATFRLAAVKAIDWLGGVLVDFETDAGDVTLHEPGRKILIFNRRYGPSDGRLDPLIAAGTAVRWTHGFLPWSAGFAFTVPEQCADETFRMSLTEHMGPVEMPSRVDITFRTDGTVTWMWAYHEVDAPTPEVHVTREDAIELAERFADTESQIFRGCRYGSVSLAMRLCDYVFRTQWIVDFPPATWRPNIDTDRPGWGGTVQLDASTGEILAFTRNK